MNHFMEEMGGAAVAYLILFSGIELFQWLMEAVIK